ncbi:MAG: hypothetical protein ACK5L7_00215 [Paludibacteraceae bacterium]
MKNFNNFFLGLVIGLVLPVVFIWFYLYKFFPSEKETWEIVKQLYPSTVLGKLLLLSIVPDLAVVFVFYKQDTFRVAGGIMISAVLYLIAAVIVM